jgi:outer membrane murein-binding lipoprotein Lpp
MRPIIVLSAVVLAAGLALGGCAEKKEPVPGKIDPAELAAVKEKLSRIRDEVRAASEKAGEVSRKAREQSADAGPAPATEIRVDAL